MRNSSLFLGGIELATLYIFYLIQSCHCLSIKELRYLQTVGPTGYFSDGGVGNKCHSSCLTCVNASECTSCSNKLLNSTTKLCELCPNGQFYTESLKKGLDGDGSCSGDCAYQSHGFDGPAGKKFQLGKSEKVAK